METKIYKVIVAIVFFILAIWAISNLIFNFQTIDRDGDGLSDDEEEKMGTNPLDMDSDNDGINDFEENQYWNNRTTDAVDDPLDPNGDVDGDGIDNIIDEDSDNDGIPDGQELEDGTDPAKKDTDGDGVDDGDESSYGNYGTDPNNPDSDEDGIPDGVDDTPSGPKNPGDLTYGNSAPSDRTHSPSRNGGHTNPTCFAIFDKVLYGRKRYAVQDAIDVDYTAYIADQTLYKFELSDTELENVFIGTITLDLSNDEIAIPSVSPNANILSYTWDDPLQDITLEFFKDGADNYYIKSSQTYGKATLIYTTSADSSYYNFDIPDDKTLDDIPESVKHIPPASVISKANIVIDELGLTGKTNLKEIIMTLYDYFSSFQPGEIPSESEQPDPYLAMALSQHGCCYIRSFACFVTANSIGIPTRLVSNECHAFVEMYIPNNGWTEVQLGGCGTNICNPDGNPIFDGNTDPYDDDDYNDDDQQPSHGLIPTNTTITQVSTIAYKGDEFTVEGFVTDNNNIGISGMYVEIFVNETKNTIGDFAGDGFTGFNGYFQINCLVPAQSETGTNQILAHAVKNDIYGESWSDPTIEIYSNTTIKLDTVNSVGLGYYLNIAGILVDDGEIPLGGETIIIQWDDTNIKTTTTNINGFFSVYYSPTNLGTYELKAIFEGGDYLGPSEDSKSIIVKDVGSNLELTVEPTTIKRGNNLNVQGKLITGSDTPIPGVTIGIYHDGDTVITTTTSTQGEFDETYTISTTSKIGIITVKAVFPGTDLYGGKDARQTITVQADTQLTLTSPANKNIEQNESIVISGLLKDDAGQTLENMQINVDWSFNSVALTTNSEGDFNFTYKIPANATLGTSIITADFIGQGYYLQSQDTMQINIIEPGTTQQKVPEESQNKYILLAIAAIIIAIIIGVIMIFKKQSNQEGPTIEQIATQTIDNLRTGNDYRKSVLECYKQMCNWLSSKGIRKVSHQTPREFAMTAKNFLKISPESLYNLTQIFEKARYSTHDINLQDRDNAINYLNEIIAAPVNIPVNNPVQNAGETNR